MHKNVTTPSVKTFLFRQNTLDCQFQIAFLIKLLDYLLRVRYYKLVIMYSIIHDLLHSLYEQQSIQKLHLLVCKKIGMTQHSSVGNKQILYVFYFWYNVRVGAHFRPHASISILNEEIGHTVTYVQSLHVCNCETWVYLNILHR